MKYYLVVGERSGDLHASNLMKEIKKLDTKAEFRFFGGEQMQTVGGTLVRHYQEMAIMGFVEVLLNIRKIARFLKECKQDILEYKPDVVILVDYAGFNMRIAKFCKKNNIKNFYYISPKVWAWNTKRALKIKQNVDKMFVIFPFEKNFFKQFDYEVDFVGNPLLDAIRAFVPNTQFLENNKLDINKKIIAVLPGSRKGEVSHILPIMLSTYGYFKDYQWVVAGVKNLSEDFYTECKRLNIPIIYDQTYDLLAHAYAAVVTSGTATLETALFNIPQVVCYKGSWISYQIAKRLIKVPYISLVNLVLNKQTVVELIQDQLNTENLIKEIEKTLGGETREIILKDYKTLQQMMGTAGASEITAKQMYQYLITE
ncbi:MAG: lipid-A-disaccharide synthase [Raineya sp.]|jgi:lipid-A-disaccharide synthase|nr:lipid-A-disaccharide synthase [Raineya sp.]